MSKMRYLYRDPTHAMQAQSEQDYVSCSGRFLLERLVSRPLPACIYGSYRVPIAFDIVTKRKHFITVVVSRWYIRSVYMYVWLVPNYGTVHTSC